MYVAELGFWDGVEGSCVLSMSSFLFLTHTYIHTCAETICSVSIYQSKLFSKSVINSDISKIVTK